MKRVGQIFRQKLVQGIEESLDQNKSVFLISYSQIPSIHLSEFRKSLRKAGADVYVSRNKIAQIALKNAGHDAFSEKVTGQMAFIWSNTDAVEVAKVLMKFVKNYENVKVQGGLLEGKILNGGDVEKLSELPSRDVLLAMLLSTIQAPLTRFAGALNAKTRELVSILKQLSEKKGGN